MFLVLKLYSGETKTDSDNIINNEINKWKARAEAFKEYSCLHLIKSKDLEDFAYSSSGQHANSKKKSTKAIYEEGSYFFYYHTASIEIFRDDQIQEVFFIKYPYTVDLSGFQKDMFNLDVERSTTKAKVNQLISKTTFFIKLMKFNYYLRAKNKLISLLFTHENFYLDMSFYFVKKFLTSPCLLTF